MTLTPTRLAKIRKDLNWTFEVMGKKTGYSRGYIHKFESGQSPITKEFSNRLMNALEIHIKEIEKIIVLLAK